MTSTNKGIVLRTLLGSMAIAVVLNSVAVAPVLAEPLLLIYPSSPTLFRYDPARYREVNPDDPKFDIDRTRGGKMLWDMVENRVPTEIYHAPQLYGFEESPDGINEFITMTNRFDLIIDGFHDGPRQLNNLYIRFIPDLPYSDVCIYVGDDLLDRLIHPIPGFDVTTHVGNGYYSNTQQYHIIWSLAVGMRISVYSDKNGNLVYDDGAPRFSIRVLDNSIPVKEKTWGGIKALYGPD